LGQKYLLSLIPIFSLLLGWWVISIIRWNIILGSLVLVSFIFTNLPFVISERLLHPSYITTPVSMRFYLGDYITSLFHPYLGPIEGTVEFFKDKGVTITHVYADYEVDSLKFYLPGLIFVDRRITPGELHVNPQVPQDYAEKVEYYLPRRFWGDLGKVHLCEKTIVNKKFRTHTLPFYDLEWNNLPDITYHKFRLDPHLPPLIIYEKEPAADFSECKRAGGIEAGS
jgi:hypothetical protein